MYTTEKMWKKFIRTRHYRKWRKKMVLPAANGTGKHDSGRICYGRRLYARV